MARIAVVGACIAGLACARTLLEAGHAVRVFEKSRGVGGRMATRRTPQGSYDHGAQYFTARDPVFRSLVDRWLKDGLAAPYAGHIVQLQSGKTQPLSHAEQRYVAVPAMTAVCRALADGVDVVSDCQVSAVTPGEESWRLSWEEGGESGFDAVVLAIIIPETCEMIGTIRTLDSKMQKEVHERIKNTAEHIAASCAATAEVSIETKTLVTYNDPALVKKTLFSLVTAAGADKTKEMNWITGSEDFSYYGEKVPSFFFVLGALPKGKDPKTAPSHHTADFYIDESGFDVGVKAFCQLVFDYAKTK